MKIFCFLPYVGVVGLVTSLVLIPRTLAYTRRDVFWCAVCYLSIWLLCAGALCK